MTADEGNNKFNWQKLSPEEFRQLQDFAAYSNKSVNDVLLFFQNNGVLSNYSTDGNIDFTGFKILINLFLEVNTPEDLMKHLFQSFVRVPKKFEYKKVQSNKKNLMEEISYSSLPSSIHYGLSEKLHGLSEKLQVFGLLSSEFQETIRKRTGSLEESGQIKHSVGKSKARFSSAHTSPHSKPETKLSIKQKKMLSGEFESWSHQEDYQRADTKSASISVKDLICYLSLLEGGRPEDKLEFMFHLYDTDGNGYLDSYEIDAIINQMMTVAEYIGWETTELRPILEEMMVEIDYDSDGTVSLKEWKRGGMTNIPLLVLLGMDTNIKEDGKHSWRLKIFSKPSYCNLCLTVLAGMGRKGLSCTLCKYTVHERCVQRVPASCISTYTKSTKTTQKMLHHWIEGNTQGKCSKCRKQIKNFNGINGLHCRWCHLTLHNHCASHVSLECKLGINRTHVLPPSSICPTVLDRQRSLPLKTEKVTRSNSVSSLAISSSSGSFQITPLPDTAPLLVFVNPKSGGRQGSRILRKCQYYLNPRQVFNLSTEGPILGLTLFKDVPHVRILICGGDGTIGWVLEALDKISFITTPSICIIPLGTGNDLARCLRWGGGYEGASVWKILNKISCSSTVMLDRWKIMIHEEKEDEEEEDEEKLERLKKENKKIPFNIINNYFSIGVDAAICCKFHLEREKNPNKFNNRMKNKLWYFEYATSEQFSSSCKNLQENIEIFCDNVPILLKDGPTLQGIAVLNIPSTHGGTNMWGDSKTPKKKKKTNEKDYSRQKSSFLSFMDDSNLASAVQDIGDKKIEVVGLENCLHMGQVRTGLRSSGKRLAQCKSLTIITKKKLPMQVDGEPWEQSPCRLEITHQNQIPMMMAPPPRSRSFFSFLKGDKQV